MTKAKESFNIYVLGNELVKEDSIPIKLLSQLKKTFSAIQFIQLDPSEILPEEKNFIILDTVANIDEVKIIKDIDKIEFKSRYSLHDCDLGFNLKLMKKLGKIKDVTIIGVPGKIKQERAFREVKKVISSLLLRNE